MAQSIAPPDDLVSPPDDLVAVKGPPDDLIQPPDDLVAAPAQRGFFEALGAGATAGVEALGEQAGTLGALATGRAAEAAVEGAKPPTALDERTRDMSIWQKITDPEWLAYNIGQTAPQSAPFLGGAIAGGAAGSLAGPVGTLIGAMVGGGGAAGAQQLAEAYNEARRAGQDHDKAVDTAMIAGLASAGINAASVPAGLLRIAKGPIQYALTQMAVQPAIGGAEQAAQNVIARERGVDPDRPIGQGVPEAIALEALFEGPAQAAGTFAGRRALPQGQQPPPDLVAPTEAEPAAVEPPAKAPDINEPFGFEIEPGRVVPARVLEYFEQDGTLYARLAEETPDAAAMSTPEVVAVDDMLGLVRDAVPEPEGRARPTEAEPVSLTDEAARFGEGVPDEPESPQGRLAVETPQGPLQMRIENLSPRTLDGAVRANYEAAERLERDPVVALDRYMSQQGMSPEEAEAAVQRDIAKFRENGRMYEAERRRRQGEETPDVDPRAGLTPLLRQRPEVSEADTGPLTRPRPEGPGPVQGALGPVAGSEAETGVPLTRPRREAPLMTMRGGVPVSTELAGRQPTPRQARLQPQEQRVRTPEEVEADRQAAEARAAEAKRRAEPAAVRYFDYDKKKSFVKMLDRTVGKRNYTLEKSGGGWRATVKDGVKLTEGQREALDASLNAQRQRRTKASETAKARGPSQKSMSLLESIAQRGIRAGSPAAQRLGEPTLARWKPEKALGPGRYSRLIVQEGDPRWQNAVTETDQLAGFLEGIDPLYIGEEYRGNKSAYERVEELIGEELSGNRQMPLDYYDSEQAAADRAQALVDQYGNEADATDIDAALDARDVVDPDDPSTYMDYEPPPVSDAEWASIMEEYDVGQRDAGGEASPRAEESAVGEGRDGEARVEAREAGTGAAAAGETEAAGAPVRGTTETVRNVVGATEQGVIPGTEQSAKQAQAARDAKGGLRATVEQKKADEGLFSPPAIAQETLPMSPDQLFVQMGERQYPVKSLAEASDKFARARDTYGEGASKTPTPIVVDGRGDVVGYIAYNGKVFPGRPQDWQEGVKPLFTPGEPEAPRLIAKPDDQNPLFELQSTARETERMSEQAVRDAIAAIAGPEAAKRAVVEPGTDGIRGSFDPADGVISVAVRSPDMRGTLRHESLHYLKSMGAFSPTEWATLEKAAVEWREKYDIDRRYNEDTVTDVSPETLERIRKEEAIAAAYAEWARGDMPGLAPKIRALFERIRAILDAIRARVMGSPETARAIFYNIDNGKYVAAATRADRARFASAVADADMAAATVAADGEQAVGGNVPRKEAAALRMFEREPIEKRTGPRWLSWGTRIASFPLARAANDPMFAPYVNAELSRQKRESAITRTIQTGVEPIFRLPTKEQNEVRKALELIALNNSFPPVINGRMTVQNQSGKIARLTGPKRIVRLSPEATKAMLSYKAGMDAAWDAYATGAVRNATNYTGDMTVEAAQAAAQQAVAAGQKSATKDAETAALILQAAKEQKRRGYYPAMRDGDTQVIVRRKLTPEFARIIGMARSRGYPKGEPLTAEGLDKFVDAARTTKDIEFWSGLRSDFDDARGEKGVVSVNDDMVWNEHFYVKPPFMGEVIPMTERARQRATEAKKAEVAELMTRRGLDMREYEIVTRPVRESLQDTINDQSVPVFEKLLKVATDGDPKMFAELWPQMRDAIAKELVSGFRKRSDVVPGFSMDIGDTLSRYSHAVGNVAAKLEYKKGIDESLRSIMENHPDPAMRGSNGYAARLKDYVDNPAQDYNALKSFGFMYYLAGVPSTAVQNMAQVPMLMVPQMTGLLGVRGAGIVRQAWTDSLRGVTFGKGGVRMDVSKLGKTPAERAFLKRMDDEGQISASVTRELMGRDYDVGPRLEAAQGFWRKTYTVAASMFDAAESLNRATALLAGYRAAQVPGADAKLKKVYGQNQNYREMANRDGTIDPEAFGEFFSREVNFEGSRVNRPEALRGAGGVILQFKSYPMNYISLLRKNATQMGPEGKAAFIMMIGMMLLGGGLLGLPFAEDMADLFDQVAKIVTDENEGAVHTLAAMMEDWRLGKYGAEMMLRGVSRPTGVDLSRTLGMGNIAPRMDNPVAVLGPTASALLAGPYYGYKRLDTGQSVASAAMEVAPRALKGPLQAAAVLPEEGLVSRTGRQIIPPSEVSTGAKAARALGFQPTEFSREYEARGYRQDVQAKALAEATRLKSQYQRLNALAYDQERAGDKDKAEQTKLRARRVAENMAAKGIAVPRGRDAVGPNVDPEAAAVRQAPRRVRERMMDSPYPGRE